MNRRTLALGVALTLTLAPQAQAGEYLVNGGKGLDGYTGGACDPAKLAPNWSCPSAPPLRDMAKEDLLASQANPWATVDGEPVKNLAKITAGTLGGVALGLGLGKALFLTGSLLPASHACEYVCVAVVP